MERSLLRHWRNPADPLRTRTRTNPQRAPSRQKLPPPPPSPNTFHMSTHCNFHAPHSCCGFAPGCARSVACGCGSRCCGCSSSCCYQRNDCCANGGGYPSSCCCHRRRGPNHFYRPTTACCATTQEDRCCAGENGYFGTVGGRYFKKKCGESERAQLFVPEKGSRRGAA